VKADSISNVELNADAETVSAESRREANFPARKGSNRESEVGRI
jgi:hypothetical protein